MNGVAGHAKHSVVCRTDPKGIVAVDKQCRDIGGIDGNLWKGASRPSLIFKMLKLQKPSGLLERSPDGSIPPSGDCFQRGKCFRTTRSIRKVANGRGSRLPATKFGITADPEFSRRSHTQLQREGKRNPIGFAVALWLFVFDLTYGAHAVGHLRADKPNRAVIVLGHGLNSAAQLRIVDQFAASPVGDTVRCANP